MSSRVALLSIAVVAGGAGCKATAGSARSASQVPEQGDLDTYLAALDDNASELQAAGVMVPSTAMGPTTAPKTEADGALQAEPAAEEAESYEDAAGGDASEAVVERPRKRDTADRRSNRCQRVCDLAEMACELEAKICDLAAEHTGEDRYQRACVRARSQCEAASEACSGCG